MQRFWILPLFAVACLFGKDLGKSGMTFPIVEESLLESMKSKMALHASEIKKYAAEIEAYIQNPTPIEGISKALEKQSNYYDPTYIVEKDIQIEGRLLAKAGDKINLLKKIELPGGMLFFDGSDPAQVAWARKQPADFKWVLVKGSPLALEKQEERLVYYDQFGYYTTRFDIHHVPAKVKQEGIFLLIEEIPVNEEGEEKP
jgi:conjugal transfer pilus assembly protein TraW